MTYFITALTNDRAELIVKTAQITHCEKTANLIMDTWIAEGYKVTVREEG